MSVLDDEAHFSPYRPDGKLYGFVCVVTGVDKPVGKAIALELAAHGAACIYACAHSIERKLADDLAKTYPNTAVLPYALNITDEQDTLGLMDDILNSWGRLDVWVTSSGLVGPPSITETGPSDVRKCFETNALAPFFALKYCPPAMAKTTPKGNYPNAAPKDQKYGSIIVVSSVASTYGGYWGPCYTMASHAALGVVKSGVATLKGTGVRINLISAGNIESEISLKDLDRRGLSSQLPPFTMQPDGAHKDIIGLERAGRPDEVARVAGFLASGFSSYITGSNVIVDGGSSTMNGLTVSTMT